MMKVVNKFNFFQQIRTLLKKLSIKEISHDEVLNHHIELISSLSLSAPSGQIESIEKRDEHYLLTVTVLKHGLTGALSALPTAYTEWLIERKYRYSDSGAKAFLDMFSHRLFCLEYLAWQKCHLFARAEVDDEMPLHRAALALSGLMNVPGNSALLPYSPLFSAPVRSLLNLEIWLSHFYQTPITILPFKGKWHLIPDSERCKLGDYKIMLGQAPMIGNSRWDIQSHFDVILGPLALNEANRFLDDNAAVKNCGHLIRSYIGDNFFFSIILRVYNESDSECQLGKERLGRELKLGKVHLSGTRDILVKNVWN